MPKIVLFILTLYCQFFWPTNTQAQGFKIVSYNVLFDDLTGIYRYPKIIEFLKSTQADVICLQEVTPKFYQHLLDSADLKNRYRIFPNTRPAYYGNIILTKLTILNSDVLSIPTQMDRNIPYVDIEFEGKTIRVINVHLESLDEPESVALRQQQLKKLQSRLVNHSLVIGDFNFGDNDAAFINSDKSLGLIDLTKPEIVANAQVTYNPEENLLAKFSRSPGEPARRLDKVWSSPSISLVNYEIINVPFSDHYPLVANLMLTRKMDKL